MTESQLKGMIKFHEKCEKAYLASGNKTNAQQAHKKAEELKKELEKLNKG